MPPRAKVSLVDTNVVLRHLLADDPVQSPRATRLLQRVEAGQEAVEIPEIVLIEVVWVLDKTLSIDRGHIARHLGSLLSLPHVRSLRSKRPLLEALARFAQTRLDFVDCLLAARARASQSKVYTFDRDFRRLACASEEPR